MTEIREQVDDAVTVEGGADVDQAKAVLRNPKFLALFGSQIFTQIGGNMVLFGLTVTVFALTSSNTSVSLLLLTFLVPAVIFGAVAGVFVDMFDRRLILISTNFARGGLYLLLIFLPDQLIVIYIVTALVATLTTFFGPAEAAMIPLVVKREQLMTANSLFILMLQASFVVGFALLGPLAHTVLGGELLIIIVAAAYGIAGLLCWVLPAAPPSQAGTGLAGLCPERRQRHLRAAQGRPAVHPRPSQRRLVADLPGHRGLAHRRARLAGTGLRQGRARPRGGRSRGHPAAARRWSRQRHRHPQPHRQVPARAANSSRAA